MKFFVVLALAGVAFGAPQAAQPQGDAAAAQSQPEIDWGKCSELKPSDNEREAKAGTVDACLKEFPIPDPMTSSGDVIEKHRETVTTCALRKEGWFNDNGSYKFERARSEIINKKLSGDIEKEVLERHEECKKESTTKYKDNYIPQVQLYQACMDYYISAICSIKVNVRQTAQ